MISQQDFLSSNLDAMDANILQNSYLILATMNPMATFFDKVQT